MMNGQASNVTADVIEDEYVINRDDVSDELMSVVKSLTSSRRFVPQWYVYDTRGSEMCEELIQNSKTYNIWQHEFNILQAHADEIVAKVSSSAVLVDLGSGGSSKTRLVIEAMRKRRERFTFVPVDMAKEFIESCGRQLERDYPGLTVEPFGGLYMDGVRHAAAREEAKLFLFLGSSFSNIPLSEQGKMLQEIRANLKAADRFVLGLDMNTDRETLLQAYGKQWAPIWRDNLIDRFNKDFEGDMDAEKFEYNVDFVENPADGDTPTSYVVKYLSSSCKQRVHFETLGLDIDFEDGENIYFYEGPNTSCKWNLTQVRRLVMKSGFAVDAYWPNDEGNYSSRKGLSPRKGRYNPDQYVLYKMYEQAVPVRARIAGQTSGPLSQHAPFCQRGTDGDIRLGNADATPYNWQEGIETSSDTYEKPEVVKQQGLPPQGDHAQRTGVKFAENIDATSSTHAELRVGGRTPLSCSPPALTRRAYVAFHATSGSAPPAIHKFLDPPVVRVLDADPHKTYRYGPSRSRCSFIGTHRSYMAAAFSVAITLVIVGLAAMVFTNREGISQLSNTVDALKRNLASEQSRSTALRQRLYQMLDNTPAEGVTPPGTPVSCPEEYTEWRGFCYKAFNVSKNFWQAHLACYEDAGGTLAMPRDNDTNAFLISLYKTASKNRFFWIGLHDEDEEGKFKWLDGTALGEYNSWATGQPNNYLNREDCVRYSASQITPGPPGIIQQPEKWYDAPCYNRLLFLCQVAPGAN
ncbi:hypothetical protein Bbelb_318390 [Branchiostoma belcheri]|nr:hypothetical protein Bbelb_318390 [Branchiostoma belcheri]